MAMEDLKANCVNSTPLTPLGFLERAATIYGDCTSLVYNHTRYTWFQTYTRCCQLASSLRSLGVRRNDVVSVVAPNVPAMYELQFAVPFAGAVLNNINTRDDAPTISKILCHAEPKLVFVDCESSELLLQAISMLPSEAQHPVLVLINDASIDKPTSSKGFSHSYQGLVEKGDPNFRWIRPKSEWDPMVLNYTSGTTSLLPKGVVHCHRGTFISAVNFLIDWAVPKQPVVLWSTLYMFHVNGWNFPWGIAAMGGTNICSRDFDATTVFPLIKRHGVTHLCAAPSILDMITHSSTEEPLERPIQVLTAAESPKPAVLERAEELGFVVSHGYGLTETEGVVVSCAWKPRWNLLRASERARLKARQGVRTIGLAEMDVVDLESGKSVKHDGSTLGEVVLRGSTVMLGYLKDPEANSKCFKNGWFHTGDVGVIHPDGYLEITDRLKDMINVAGEKVSSVKVEHALTSLKEVKEAAAVPRPDDRYGESVCAFVFLNDGFKETTAEEIMEELHVINKWPKSLRIKTVVIEKEPLPRTATGKIKKSELKKRAREMGSLKYGAEAKMMTMMRLERGSSRNVVGMKIRTKDTYDMHGIMMQRRSSMNIKVFPKFALAKPRATHFTVHTVNSGSSVVPCTWL